MARKFSALFASVTALLSIATFALASPASAYPPGTCAVASLSASRVTAGGTVDVSGSGFLKNEQVAIKIGVKVTANGCDLAVSGGVQIGTATTDASGAFDPVVTIPSNLRGQQTIALIGASGQPSDRAAATLTVTAPNGGGQGTGGVTAGTGAPILTMLLVVAGLLLGGTGIAFAGRRRSRNAVRI